jgi:hypothetical protein
MGWLDAQLVKYLTEIPQIALDCVQSKQTVVGVTPLATTPRNEGTTQLIQDFLGHASIANTVRYTKLAPGRLAAVRVR